MSAEMITRAGQREPQSASDATGIPDGTFVLTQKGDMPVELITPGDKIVTRDAGLATVRSVHSFAWLGRAVCIAAGSLGDTRPEQNLTLPETQPVLIRDWRARAIFGRFRAMVPARDLIDGEFIRDVGLRPMVLHHLRFDTPHVLYAGGLELSSDGVPGARILRAAA